MLRQRVITALVLLAGCAAVGAEGPMDTAEPRSRPALSVLLGYPPGGAGDNLLRAWAPALALALRQAVVVDNRSGAAGLLALHALHLHGAHFVGLRHLLGLLFLFQLPAALAFDGLVIGQPTVRQGGREVGRRARRAGALRHGCGCGQQAL